MLHAASEDDESDESSDSLDSSIDDDDDDSLSYDIIDEEGESQLVLVIAFQKYEFCLATSVYVLHFKKPPLYPHLH